MSDWNAVLLAGQRPGTDPLSAHFGQMWKALVPVAGKPMLAHCLENLRAVPEISAITVMAQQPEALLADAQVARAAESPKVRMLASRTGIASTIAAVDGSEIAWPLLVTPADHLLLRSETYIAFLAEGRVLHFSQQRKITV